MEGRGRGDRNLSVDGVLIFFIFLKRGGESIHTILFVKTIEKARRLGTVLILFK